MSRIECDHCVDEQYDIYKAKYPEASHCMFCGRFISKNNYNEILSPEIIEKDGPMGGREERHPSYGQLSFSRCSGGHSNLYGSSVRNQHTINMKVSKSVKHFNAYDETYFERETLFEVSMSAAQFAEAITSFNMGSGVPVTLKYIRGEYMPLCDEISKSQRANDHLKEKMTEFANRVGKSGVEIDEIVNKKGAINVGERKKIGNLYKNILGDVKSNLPFLNECMTEAYEKTVAHAKAEIEAFYLHGLTKLGIDNLDKSQISVNDSGRLEYNKTLNSDDDVVDVQFDDTNDVECSMKTIDFEEKNENKIPHE